MTSALALCGLLSLAMGVGGIFVATKREPIAYWCARLNIAFGSVTLLLVLFSR